MDFSTLNKVYEGKTKDVFALHNGNYLLHFKDSMTGENGVFDPGANTVGLTLDGIGKKNLAVSSLFFNKLNEHNIDTHFVKSDVEDGTCEVLACSPFGKGVEVICRLRAVGSFVKRYGMYIESGAHLPYFVEFTLKDDDRCDPPISREGLSILNIMHTAEYDEITSLTRRITEIIASTLGEKDLTLYDIKLEFGKTESKIVLIDEISSGNMRVYKGETCLAPEELTSLILA